MKKTILFAFTIISFLTNPLSSEEKYQYQLSVMTIFQNEARYLKEWIDYNRLIGVEHFYLYNHHSTDHYLDVLSPYIENGIVELIEYSRPGFPQLEAMEDGLEKARGVSKWVAMIDTDEFIFPKEHETVTEFLKEFEPYGAVSINWQCFGTSNVPFIPPGELMIEQLTFRAENSYFWHNSVKCIVRPDRVYKVKTAHSFEYQSPYTVVRPNHKRPRENGNTSASQTKRIVLNHYWTRDEDFYLNVKVPRCKKIKGWTDKRADRFRKQLNQVEDRGLAEKFGEKLKQLQDID